MNLPCRMIEDLLPLYHDGVCSAESGAAVEEHIAQCESCAGLLRSMGEGEKSPRVDDAAPLRAIGSRWRKGKKRAFIKGGLIALLACAVILGGYLGLTRWKCIPVPASLLEVSQVSRLADGRIIYHLSVKDDKNLHFVKFTTNEDGSYYMTPMRSVIEGGRKMESGLFNDYYLVDIAENNAYEQSNGDGIVITSCYVGPENGGILIWEEGMELPAAGEELERLADQ